ncbi:MAG TPA: multidrug effflux MFS transporter [Gammaproteobacteria bacterium]
MKHFRLAAVLAFVVALGPFALDAYLPAFPAIAIALGISTGEVGLTISVYVIALAAGQLVGGPLSDRFGRAPVMFGGLGMFLAGSLLVAISDSLAFMLFARIVQAFGGGFSMVSVPAIARDRTEGRETAQLFSLIALIMFIAPAIAPTIGALLLALSGWQSIFIFLAVYAVLAAALMKLTLFRGRRKRRRPIAEPLHRLATNYLHVIRHRDAMRFIGLQAMVFSIMLVYLTHAPFLYMDWLGFSNAGFSMLFATNVAVMAGFSLANRQMLGKREPVSILKFALSMQAGGIALLGAVALFDLPGVIAIPALAIAVGSLGAIAPNNTASVMHYFRELSGTAAAVMGAIQFTVSGVISGLVSLFAAQSVLVTIAVMAACSALAFLLLRAVRRSASETFPAETDRA